MGKTVLSKRGSKWTTKPFRVKQLAEKVNQIPSIAQYIPYANAKKEVDMGIYEGIEAMQKDFGVFWTPMKFALLDYVETYGLQIKELCEESVRLGGKFDCENETFDFLESNKETLKTKQEDIPLFMDAYENDIIDPREVADIYFALREKIGDILSRNR